MIKLKNAPQRAETEELIKKFGVLLTQKRIEVRGIESELAVLRAQVYEYDNRLSEGVTNA